MKTKGVQKSGEHINRPRQSSNNQLLGLNLPQKRIMGVILIVALLAFELFNFDTTRYALSNLLGDVRFVGIGWATILAIAFCAIDFAGLARLFTPERGKDEPTAVWYLMGAWLLGATMNAVMTWWAISLTLLSHEFGNEVLSREQLLRWVPFFVATLVWLTRILFIGAVSVAGEYMFDMPRLRRNLVSAPSAAKRPSISRQPKQSTPTGGRPFRPNPAPIHASSQPENGDRSAPSAPRPTNPARPGPAVRRASRQAPGRSQTRQRR